MMSSAALQLPPITDRPVDQNLAAATSSNPDFNASRAALADEIIGGDTNLRSAARFVGITPEQLTTVLTPKQQDPVTLELIKRGLITEHPIAA